jgi:hypothetical protein
LGSLELADPQPSMPAAPKVAAPRKASRRDKEFDLVKVFVVFHGAPANASAKPCQKISIFRCDVAMELASSGLHAVK